MGGRNNNCASSFSSVFYPLPVVDLDNSTANADFSRYPIGPHNLSDAPSKVDKVKHAMHVRRLPGHLLVGVIVGGKDTGFDVVMVLRTSDVSGEWSGWIKNCTEPISAACVQYAS